MALDDSWLDPVTDCGVMPREELDPDTAHSIMRRHAHWSGSPCLQRRAALNYLVDIGHYHPGKKIL